jgi:hypothetical protein
MNITIPSPLVTQILTGFRPLKLARAKLDILRCLAFAFTPGQVVVTGTNLDQSLTFTGPLENTETTSLLVPFDLLVQAHKGQADGVSFSSLMSLPDPGSAAKRQCPFKYAPTAANDLGPVGRRQISARPYQCP